MPALLSRLRYDSEWTAGPGLTAEGWLDLGGAGRHCMGASAYTHEFAWTWSSACWPDNPNYHAILQAMAGNATDDDPLAERSTLAPSSCHQWQAHAALEAERNRTVWKRTHLRKGGCTYIADTVGLYWIYAPERRNGPGQGACDVGCDDQADAAEAEHERLTGDVRPRN